MTAPVIDLDAVRLRRDLESRRAYLAGPCNHNEGRAPRCPKGAYDGHRHWNAWYEAHRSEVVLLSAILENEFPREFYDAQRETLDPKES